MHERFSEYYEPTEKQFNTLFRTATIVLDTNILLDFYRSSETTTKEVLEVLTAARDQLWLPYRVGVEYHENVQTVIQEIDSHHVNIKKTLRDGLNKLRGGFSAVRHPFMKDQILKQIDDFENLALKDLEIENWDAAKLQKYAKEISDQVFQIFPANRIGEPFTEDETKAIVSEGKTRYERQIPPGFNDKGKTGGYLREYGDLIIWKEILRFAKLKKLPIIMISADTKDDWYRKIGARLRGPLPALRAEMKKESGQEFYLYTMGQFLKYGAPIYLKRVAEANAIAEVDRAQRAQAIMEQMIARVNSASETDYLTELVLGKIGPSRLHFLTNTKAGNSLLGGFDSERLAKILGSPAYGEALSDLAGITRISNSKFVPAKEILGESSVFPETLRKKITGRALLSGPQVPSVVTRRNPSSPIASANQQKLESGDEANPVNPPAPSASIDPNESVKK